MKTGTTGHIKFRRLKRLLNLEDYEAGGILTLIWDLAATCAPDGVVGKFSDDDIASYVGWPRRGDDRTAEDLINALVTCGWIDRLDDGNRLRIHDWDDHKPYYLRDRERQRATRSKTDAPRSVQHASKNVQDAPRTVQDSPGHEADIPGRVRQITGQSAPRPTQPNPTQPSPTKPKQVCAVEPIAELIPTDLPPPTATPPEFDDALATVWQDIAAVDAEANPNGHPIRLTRSRRYALHEALREETAADIVATFRCLSLSPNPRALAIRSKWRGIDTVLQMDKLRGYVEFAKSADAWNAGGAEAEANDRAIEESLARITRGAPA